MAKCKPRVQLFVYYSETQLDIAFTIQKQCKTQCKTPRTLHVMDGLAFGFHQLDETMTLREFRQVFHGLLMGTAAVPRRLRKQPCKRGMPT